MAGTSPEAIKSALAGFMTGNLGNVLLKYTIFGLAILGITLLFFGIYMLVIHKYKCKIFTVVGSGNPKQPYTIGKTKSDFARIKKDGSWSFLLNKKQNIEPIDSKFIYSGNKVYLFKINEQLIPGQISCSVENFAINPIPYSVRKKAELELQQLEQDFAKQDFWTQNKQLIMGAVTVAICCAFAGFVIWLSFKKTDQMIPAFNSLTESLRNVNTIQGKG